MEVKIEPKKIQDLSQKEIYTELMVDAQKKQIVVLNRKIVELKAENEELKQRLKQLQLGNVKDIPKKADQKLSDEEVLCRQEIGKLLDVSNDRELTLEESKKLDIYTKIINNKKVTEEKDKEVVNLSDAELLQFLKVGTK